MITELTLQIRGLKLPYFAPKECLIKGDGEYQGEKFRENEIIKSNIFPELNLNTEQIFRGDL